MRITCFNLGPTGRMNIKVRILKSSSFPALLPPAGAGCWYLHSGVPQQQPPFSSVLVLPLNIVVRSLFEAGGLVNQAKQ